MRLLLAILFSCIFLNNYSQEKINQRWVSKDRHLIDSLSLIDKNNSQVVEAFFNRSEYSRRKESLGFGWSMSEKQTGGGYISLYAIFYYYHDTIQTYFLHAWLPDEKSLINSYSIMYSKFLTLNSDGISFSYKFHPQEIYKPIAEYDFTGLNTKIPFPVLQYMSPESGISYGLRGGMGSSLLENRQAFLAIKDSLTHDQILAMMFSINPASRLTAIEFYLRNKRKFPPNSDIDAWIEKVFKEFPKIQTMSGCIGFHDDSKTLVREIVALTAEQYKRCSYY